jgi:hypothetical protein
MLDTLKRILQEATIGLYGRADETIRQVDIDRLEITFNSDEDNEVSFDFTAIKQDELGLLVQITNSEGTLDQHIYLHLFVGQDSNFLQSLFNEYT